MRIRYKIYQIVEKDVHTDPYSINYESKSFESIDILTLKEIYPYECNILIAQGYCKKTNSYESQQDAEHIVNYIIESKSLDSNDVFIIKKVYLR